MMVDRYNGIEQDTEGAYVYYQDYQALEAVLADVQYELKELKEDYQPFNDTDRRNPFTESRRRSDCFPDGGCVAITIAAFSLISFCLGFGLGWWVM